MRKINKPRRLALEPEAMDADLLDPRPLRISGATITSWSGTSRSGTARSGSPADDVDRMLDQTMAGATVAGAGSAPSRGSPDDHPTKETVSLTDGTRVTFATAGRFDAEEHE